MDRCKDWELIGNEGENEGVEFDDCIKLPRDELYQQG